jgi:hypothetical protein
VPTVIVHVIAAACRPDHREAIVAIRAVAPPPPVETLVIAELLLVEPLVATTYTPHGVYQAHRWRATCWHRHD